MEDAPDQPVTRPTPTPERVKPHILLQVIGVLILGLMFGSFLVWRSIKKDGRSQAERIGGMDHRPLPPVIGTNTGPEPRPPSKSDE